MLATQLSAKISNFLDPYTEKSLAELKAVKDVSISGDNVNVHLTLPYPIQGLEAVYQQQLALLLPANLQLKLALTQHIASHQGKAGIASLKEVKNLLAVASGKGGVGKSTVAVNLALSLAKAGANVGLVDADIYGPSLPNLVGAVGEKAQVLDKRLQPLERYGLQTMSMGYLVEQNTALAWRGPMLGKALQQLIYDTNWQALDYLIIDLPPGTGDVQLSLCQKMPLTGALIVTTPQDIALADVRRACEMFKTLSIPILGVVENMSTHVCTQCGHAEAIFGKGGADLLAQSYGMDVVARLPLQAEIAALTDNGTPVVTQSKEPYVAEFLEMARKIAAKLAHQPKNYSAVFPKIVIKHDKE